jgi:intracellular septation protein
MQFLIDFLPLVIFLAVFKLGGFYAATISLMITLPIIPLSQKLLGKPVSRMHLFSAVLVVVFGGITLLLRDPIFLMWKPTVLYAVLSAGFFATQWFTPTTAIERMLGHSLSLNVQHWRHLNTAWAVFFAAAGAANLYVAFNFPEATWVNFKVWGLLGLTLGFVVLQSFWLSARMLPEDERKPEQG